MTFSLHADLQQSRVARTRQATTLPANSKLYQRCSSETHLNFPSRTTTRGHTLPNGSLPWSSTSPSPGVGDSRTQGNRSAPPPHHGSSEDNRGFMDSLPNNVQQLRSYFEKLTRDGEEEMARRQSIGQKTSPGRLRKGKGWGDVHRATVAYGDILGLTVKLKQYVVQDCPSQIYCMEVPQ